MLANSGRRFATKAKSTPDEAPRIYTAQLSPRYSNFVAPLLTLSTLGGLPALLVAISGREGSGWWPVVWLAASFAAVFFSAAFMSMAGRRRLPVAYCIALSAVVGLAIVAYGLLLANPRHSWGAAMPTWLRSMQIKRLIQWPWAPLLPYGAGLAVHGLILLRLSRPPPPRSRG